MIKQVDNGKMPEKLALRRRFLDRYPATSVFDCCQGKGKIWNILRREYAVKYFGVDKKHMAGRLTIDSARILSISGHDFDVIDIDTYGSPWEHYYAALKTITRPCTIFLTIGFLRLGGGTSKLEQDSIGINFSYIPPGLLSKTHDFCVLYMLTQIGQYDIILTDAEEVVSDAKNVRYIAVRVKPKGDCPCH